MSHIANTLKHVLDAFSVATIIATLAGILPPLAALLSIVWLSIQIYDNFAKKRDKKKNLRRRSTDYADASR